MVGESYSILWETTGEISNVKIEFSTKNVTDFYTVNPFPHYAENEDK